mgnify:CR=1 FL=1|tara:strand:- start:894 stop:1661 length:768 start_codon:yes stop_codon:yes gene_type:complete
MRNILRNLYLLVLGSVRKPKPGIHIINAHFVTPNSVDEFDGGIFEQFLLNIKKNCTLISVQKAVKLINDNYKSDEALVALTFDDGFEECYTSMAPILDKHNIKAAFFINSNYVASEESYQKAFNERINTYTKKPMNWNQVIDLHKRGHVIGSHSLDHLDFGKISQKELEFQLLRNKELLEDKLAYNCEYFAWTYGQFSNFPESALEETLKHHRIIFSGTNYKKYFSYGKKVINRRHIEPFWNQQYINYFLAIKKK